MLKHEHLDCVGALTTRQQDDQLQCLAKNQVAERHDHGRQHADSRRSHSGQSRTSGPVTEFSNDSGTIAYDEAEDRILPHIHVSVGLKEHSATAHTSHLLSAKVQFLTEMLVVEVAGPSMSRERDTNLYDVPLLRFGTAPH